MASYAQIFDEASSDPAPRLGFIYGGVNQAIILAARTLSDSRYFVGEGNLDIVINSHRSIELCLRGAQLSPDWCRYLKLTTESDFVDRVYAIRAQYVLDEDPFYHPWRFAVAFCWLFELCPYCHEFAYSIGIEGSRLVGVHRRGIRDMVSRIDGVGNWGYWCSIDLGIDKFPEESFSRESLESASMEEAPAIFHTERPVGNLSILSITHARGNRS